MSDKGNARQSDARQSDARQSDTRHPGARHGDARHGDARHGDAPRPRHDDPSPSAGDRSPPATSPPAAGPSTAPASALKRHASRSPSPSTREPAPMSPDALLPLLHCPLCAPPRPLRAPVTLRCGHSICAEHAPAASSSPSSSSSYFSTLFPAPAPPCPIPSCTFDAARPPDPQPTPPAGVTFTPAPAAPHPTPPTARLDITLNNILALCLRARRTSHAPRPPAHSAGHSDSDSAADSDRARPSEPEASEPEHSARAADARDRPAGPSRDGRPRKRRRRHPARAPPQDPSAADPAAQLEKELLAELTCEICFALLYQPVTTPCQHTFCAPCLARALDHSPACPLCRQTLPPYDYFQEHPCNKAVLALLLRACPAAYRERGEMLDAEARDARLDTPLFVAQLSFPGMPTLLHFFEPRYRLMLRRCLAAPYPAFGMVPPPRGAGAGAAEYGTMLEIRNVQMLPDGRSVVETWGAWRFRVMERGSLDGYGVARVERVDDWPEAPAEDVADSAPARTPAKVGAADDEGAGAGAAGDGGGAAGEAGSAQGMPGPSTRGPSSPPPAPGAPTNAELMRECLAFLEQLREGTPWVVQHLNTSYVPMPGDPAGFSFWMAMLLPIDEHEKAKLLPIRSPRLRLRLVVHWIEQLNSNWWFSGGCTVC